MLSNDLKKGDRVVLHNGWRATIEDNKKGNIRMATVHGYETEMGSIYIWDIRGRLPATIQPGHFVELEPIELTKAQLKAKTAVNAYGF